MKKIIWIIFALVGICVILLFVFSLSNIPNVSSGTVCYEKNGRTITTSLLDEDLTFLLKTFRGKLLYRDKLYCGFNESTSVILGDQIFCIARDGCAKVYWKNQNKYLNLSNREYLDLIERLENYGFEI